MGGVGRRVSLVLCTAGDGVLGVLPGFDVPTPYWQEVREVVEGARGLHGVDVAVLRLLSAAQETPPDGGDVTYLAEVTGGAVPSLAPWTGPDPLADHPLRMPWARPGGPRYDVGWAVAALRAAGREPLGRPEQVRTWNLSALWRLPATDGAGGRADAWLKVVPPFFAHEGRLLDALQPTGVVPTLLAHGTARDGCHRSLLADVPGEDRYGAGPDDAARFAALLAGVQADAAAHVGDLLARGVPDRRDAEPLLAGAQRLLDLTRTGGAGAGRLAPAFADDARRLVEALPDLLARERACGLPDTLVHGDFHPGNVRGVPGAWRILDWGDGSVGQPAVDLATATNAFDDAGRRAVVEAAAGAWRAAGVDADVAGAVGAARPVAALRAALAWQGFLDRIEPDEHPYHEGDPAAGLEDAVEAFRRFR